MTDSVSPAPSGAPSPATEALDRLRCDVRQITGGYLQETMLADISTLEASLWDDPAPAPTPNETKYFRWAYSLMIALAKRRLGDAQQEGAWEGHNWDDLVTTSHHALFQKAREEAGIPNDEFRDVVNSGQIDVGDLYALACGCDRCRADYPQAFAAQFGVPAKGGDHA